MSDVESLIAEIHKATEFLNSRPKRRGVFEIPQEELVFTNGMGSEFKVSRVTYNSLRETIQFVVEPLHEEGFIIPEVPKGQEIPRMDWILDADVPWRLEHRHES